jgi:hypothetical protein
MKVLPSGEWAQANNRIREIEAELARLQAPSTSAPDWAEQVAVSFGDAALWIERVAQDLNDSRRE